MPSDNLHGAGLMTLSMATYTLNDACVKWLAQGLPEFQVIALRGVAASLLMLALVWRSGMLFTPIPAKDRVLAVGRVVAEMLILVPFVIALTKMPLANIIAILQVVPLVLTAAGALFLGEAVGWRRWLAIWIGFAGVLIIVRPTADGFNIYALLALLSVGLITIRDLLTRRLSPETPSIKLALYTAIGVGLLGFGMSTTAPWQPINGSQVAIILLAAGAILGGYLFSISAMRIGEIAVVTPFRYSALIWGVLGGVVVFGDWPDLVTLIGAVLVVGAGLYTLWRETKTGAVRRRVAPPKSSA